MVYGYNSRLSIEDRNTSGSLLLQQYPEIFLHYLYLLNLIPCEIYIISTQFHDSTIITYEIELPPDEKIIGFNLLDPCDFTIPYILDIIPNLPKGHQLPKKVNNNVCIISINL